jgi:hypothetical protein
MRPSTPRGSPAVEADTARRLYGPLDYIPPAEYEQNWADGWTP